LAQSNFFFSIEKKIRKKIFFSSSKKFEPTNQSVYPKEKQKKNFFFRQLIVTSCGDDEAFGYLRIPLKKQQPGKKKPLKQRKK